MSVVHLVATAPRVAAHTLLPVVLATTLLEKMIVVSVTTTTAVSAITMTDVSEIMIAEIVAAHVHLKTVIVR